jgi:hypothetical protein
MHVLRTGMRKAPGFGVIAALLLVIGLSGSLVWSHPATVAAQDPADQPAGPATIRAVHAVPGGPNVDLLIDGQPSAQGLAFGTASEYAPITPGTHQIQLVPTGQSADTALSTTEVDAQAGTAYIVTALGTASAVEMKVNEVKLEAVDTGKARVRVINASPDAQKVNVVIAGGDELAGDLDFNSDSDYSDVDAGSYTLEVHSAEDDSLLLSAPQMTFDSGKLYDIVALGQVADKSLQLLSLVTEVSPTCSQILGIGSPTDACVRFVQTDPNISAADFYIGDASVASGVTFGQGTNFINIPASDDQNIRITAAGTAPTEDQSDATQSFEAGKAYNVVVLSANGGDGGGVGGGNAANGTTGNGTSGDVSGIQVVVNELDFTPLPQNQSRVRILHTASDVDAVDVGIANGANIAEGVAFGSSSDNVTVPSGQVKLQVRPSGQDVAVLETDLTFDPATIYDILIVGRAEDNSLTLLVLNTPAQTLTGQVATPAASPVVAPGTPVATVGASPMASPVASPLPSPTPAG